MSKSVLADKMRRSLAATNKAAIAAENVGERSDAEIRESFRDEATILVVGTHLGFAEEDWELVKMWAQVPEIQAMAVAWAESVAKVEYLGHDIEKKMLGLSGQGEGVAIHAGEMVLRPDPQKMKELQAHLRRSGFDLQETAPSKGSNDSLADPKEKANKTTSTPARATLSAMRKRAMRP